MLSTTGMILLLAAYVLIAAASAWERNWYRALYFLGAGVITLALLGMHGNGR